ncbi:NAD(P)-binding protein [Tilletiaria anomala UBC 951]|uniref:NAD(P)-binding protein n=1 Tax=Tilletiaria anomala (strain ATCC 24038 / CBS 436.72 / UBC 951) TaxID=1037660 RepID=A0A066VCG6_TILAU|nr:NAD(P)-binding protein [Tilletiaria anomala UBC 951]KDN37983.1 NAD(P)-binding protein [Tilletiaria anomala UBC 951]
MHGSNNSVINVGGDSGIRRAVALAFAREACQVTITHLAKEQADAEEVQKAAASAPHGVKEIHTVPADLKSRDEAQRMVAKHVDEYGGLNILVNNASMQVQCKALEDIDLDVVEQKFQTSIIDMLAMAKFSLPHMKRGSTIINAFLSRHRREVLAWSTMPRPKASLRELTCRDSCPAWYQVCAVALGSVFAPLEPASRTPEQMEGWGVEALLLHGRPGQPAELAASYVYLADAGSNNIMTGQVLHLISG